MASFELRRLGLGSVFALAAACSASPAPVDSGTTPAQDTGVDAPSVDAARVPHDSGPFTDQCITLTYPAVTVTNGMEDTRCVVMDLGNDLPIHVGSIHNVLGAGSHHFIVYRAASTETVNLTPTHCQPFVDTLNSATGSPLMITQRHDELLNLPPGVAYTLPPHQLIRLELHYINLTGATTMISPTSTLCPISDADYLADADFLFIGNPDISLPPHTSTTLGPTFYRLDAQFADAHFFAITGHTHQLGTNVVVQTGSRAAGPFTDVYNVPGWMWAEPATVQADPPFQLPSGGGFNFTCDWTNTTDATVNFGEHTTNEMCFFWAYYYPAHAHAAHVCVHSDMGGGHYDICCPGNLLCAQISRYLGGP